MPRFIRIIFYVGFIGLVFMSCDMGQSNTINNNDGLKFFNLNLYKGKKTEVEKVGDSYLFNDSLFHTFKIGTIYNVPTYATNGIIHQGMVPTTIDLKEEKEFSKIYSSQMTLCQKNSVSTSFTAELESSIGAKIGYTGAFSVGLEAKVKSGIKSEYGTEYSNTVSESKYSEDKYTERLTKSKKIVIDQSCPAGYYSYLILDDFDVYVLLSCDTAKAEKEMQFTYLFISKQNIREGYIHYVDENDVNYPFNDVEKTELLDISLLKDFPFDYYDKSNAVYLPDIPDIKLIQNPPSPNKVSDTGQYGLEQDIKTELNLVEYEKYMNDSYVFTFKVKVTAEAYKSIFGYEQGYKQIFLFKKDPGHVDSSLTIVDSNTIRSHYGLLEEETWTDNLVTKDFTWHVRGSDLIKSENPCIKYDAWGEGEDTWYVKGLEVFLSIDPNY